MDHARLHVLLEGGEPRNECRARVRACRGCEIRHGHDTVAGATREGRCLQDFAERSHNFASEFLQQFRFLLSDAERDRAHKPRTARLTTAGSDDGFAVSKGKCRCCWTWD